MGHVGIWMGYGRIKWDRLRFGRDICDLGGIGWDKEGFGWDNVRFW